MERELTSAVAWAFLDNLIEGVIIVEIDGTVQYVNKAARALLSLDADVPPSFTKVGQKVAPQEDWQTLLDPPVEVRLYTKNGRTFSAHSKQYPGYETDLVQILIDPRRVSDWDPGPTAAIEQLTALTRISNEPNFDRKLQLIVDGLRMTGWNRVGLTLRDEAFNPTKLITAGFTETERQFIEENRMPAEMWRQFFKDESFQRFRHGSCYFIPGDSRWAQENLETILPDDKATGTEPDAWRPNDVLWVPLHDRQQQKIGLMGLDQPRNGRRPDLSTFQTIELYAQFAASVIENAQLVNETLARSRELELLFEASHAFSGLLEKDSLLSVMGQHMLQAVHADGYVIFRWDKEDDSVIILEEKAPFPKANQQSVGTKIPLRELSLVEKALAIQKPLVTQVEREEPALLRRPSWLAEDERYTSTLLPIVLSEEPFGVIEILRRAEQKAVSPRELRLLTALSNQASTTLETALMFEDTYERERFYNAVGNVNLAINYTLNRETVLDLICSESQRIFNVDGAYIWQLEEKEFVGSAAKGHAEEEFVGTTVPLTDTDAFVASIADAGEASYVNNIDHKNEVQLKLPQQESIKAALGVPLEQEGSIIGVLILVDKTKGDRFREKDVSQATIFGVQVAIALQNAKLFEELRRFNEELDLRVAERTRALHEESNRVKILLRITSELAASLDQDRVLSQALHLVNEVVNATQGVILLIDQESGELVFRSAFGVDRPLSPEGSRSGLMRDEGLAGWMIENRSSVIVHDTREDPRWVYRPTSRDHRSVLGVPLISSEEVIGVLMLFHSKSNAFTMQQLDLVEAAAIQVANAISNANLYDLISEQAVRLGRMLQAEQIETAKRQAILESIADGVIVADDRSKITLANMPASSILNIPRQELVGKSINELLGLYGHSGESWIKTIDNWAQNADRIKEWTYLADELAIEDKVISVHLSPVLTGNQFFGTVSIFRDITKEVEVDKLKSEFVSTVSHELRTPMTSIKGYADLMLMGAAGEMSKPQSRYLKVIKNNADRLHMLVNDLLNISRIETGKTALDLRPLDVPQVIEQVVEGHLLGRIQHEQKELNVHREIAPSLPLVNADHARVTQILTNLLDNAFNYTAEGGNITVSARANSNFVEISVADTGIGISEENQTKIFDRFFRAENEVVQKVPGTGLGLAIVRSLIEMHGGKLELDSTPGIGSTFTFNLPIVVEDSDPT